MLIRTIRLAAVFLAFACAVAVAQNGPTATFNTITLRVLTASGAITAGTTMTAPTSLTTRKVAPVAGTNLILGNGTGLATNATTGFVMVPSGSGTPTGVLTGVGPGVTPMYVDLSNLKLCFQIGTVWRCTTLQ